MNEQSDPAAGILDHCVAQIRRVAVQVLPDPVLDRARQALAPADRLGALGNAEALRHVRRSGIVAVGLSMLGSWKTRANIFSLGPYVIGTLTKETSFPFLSFLVI